MTWPTSCIRPHERLADHTSFRIGGPAEWFAEPETMDELLAVLRHTSASGLPVSVVGGGTNTLAADRGVRGLVLHLGSGFRTVRDISQPDDPIARVVCGASLFTQPIEVAPARLQLRAGLALTGYPHLVLRIGRAAPTPGSPRHLASEVITD